MLDVTLPSSLRRTVKSRMQMSWLLARAMTKRSKMLSTQRLKAGAIKFDYDTVRRSYRRPGGWAAGERLGKRDSESRSQRGAALVDNNSVNNYNAHARGEPAVRPSTCLRQFATNSAAGNDECSSFNRQHGPGFPSNIRPSCLSHPVPPVEGGRTFPAGCANQHSLPMAKVNNLARRRRVQQIIYQTVR